METKLLSEEELACESRLNFAALGRKPLTGVELLRTVIRGLRAAESDMRRVGDDFRQREPANLGA